MSSSHLVELFSESELLALCKSIPKIELHRHLEGSFTTDLLLRVNDRHSLKLPSKSPEVLRKLFQVPEGCNSLVAFLKSFEPIGELFHSAEAIYALTEEVLKDAEEDNVQVLELRYSPIYMADSRAIPLDEVMDATLSAIEHFQKTSDLLVGSILIIERQRPVQEAFRIIELARRYKERGIIALDLANDEQNFSATLFEEVFASETDLPRTIHSGEAAGPESIEAAVNLLGAKRIGHGVSATQSKDVMDMLRESEILVECCPTSNLQTGAVESLANHPLRAFLGEGIPVSICTDDPGVCDVLLSEELYKACTGLSLSTKELLTIYEQSLNHSFIDKARLKQASQRIMNQLQDKLL